MVQSKGQTPLQHSFTIAGNGPSRGLQAIDSPIVSAVASAVTASKGGHFLLTTENGLDIVRVQILLGLQVREAHIRTALDGLSELARCLTKGVFAVLTVVGGTDRPQRVVSCRVMHKSDNLLARTRF